MAALSEKIYAVSVQVIIFYRLILFCFFHNNMHSFTAAQGCLCSARCNLEAGATFAIQDYYCTSVQGSPVKAFSSTAHYDLGCEGVVPQVSSLYFFILKEHSPILMISFLVTKKNHMHFCGTHCRSCVTEYEASIWLT